MNLRAKTPGDGRRLIIPRSSFIIHAEMRLRGRIRTLFRLFVLFTVLMAVAMISAITTIRLSIRGHQEAMPNLVGAPLEAAEQLTGQLGLDLMVVDKLFSALYPAGRIVSQEPPVGTPIKMGQHIHVIVSLGPPRVALPNLAGMSLRAAQIATIQRGLTLGNVAAVHWEGGEADQVVAQDPPPSEENVHSPVVSFLVSLGAEPAAYECPSFVGQNLGPVRQELEGLGFSVGQITPLTADGVPKNTILAQSPAAGSKIGPDTKFVFSVAE
jgi:beta-lactam-binding protein with PASTA domain